MANIAPYSRSVAPTDIKVKLGPLDASENIAQNVSDATNDGSSNAIVYFTAPSPLVLGSTASFVRYEVLDNCDNVLGFNSNQNDSFVALTELTNFSSYNIKVRVQTSYNRVTYNGISSSQYSMTPFTFPLNTSIVRATEDDAKVYVQWYPSSSHNGFPVSYRLEYKLTTSTEWIYSVETNDVSYNFTELTNSYRHDFKITPFYTVTNQDYTEAGVWADVSANRTFKYYGNSVTVTKIPIKKPTLDNINFTANFGPMKADLTAANYANEIQNNYDGNAKIVLSWTPPLQTDLGLTADVSLNNVVSGDNLTISANFISKDETFFRLLFKTIFKSTFFFSSILIFFSKSFSLDL
jgi:hypothetical protein